MHIANYVYAYKFLMCPALDAILSGCWRLWSSLPLKSVSFPWAGAGRFSFILKIWMTEAGRL